MSNGYDESDAEAFFSGYKKGEERIQGQPDDKQTSGDGGAWSEDLATSQPEYDENPEEAFFGGGSAAPVEEPEQPLTGTFAEPKVDDDSDTKVGPKHAAGGAMAFDAEKGKAMVRKYWPVGLIAAVILILAFTVLPGVFSGQDTGDTDDTGVAINTGASSAPANPSGSAPAPTEVNTVLGQPEKQNVPQVIEGSKSPGGQGTGTDAIVAYDYAYYFKRNADLASQFFWNNKPDQKAIDENVSKELAYTMEITPIEIGAKYKVILTLKTPGKETRWEQEISTVKEGDKFFVSNIKNIGKLP